MAFLLADRRPPFLIYFLQMTHLFFFHATHGEIEVINEILSLYEEALGQCITLEKSSIFFNSKTSLIQREVVKVHLGVKEVERFESYLGLPTLIRRAKYQTFAYLKDKI